MFSEEGHEQVVREGGEQDCNWSPPPKSMFPLSGLSLGATSGLQTLTFLSQC